MGPVDSVKIQLSVVLGKSIMPINQLLRMGRGAVIELDSTEEDDVEILANNISIARGEVSIHNDRIAVTVREMTKSTKRRVNVSALENEAEPIDEGEAEPVHEEEAASLASDSGDGDVSDEEASEISDDDAVAAPESDAVEASDDEAGLASEDEAASDPEDEAAPALEDQ